MTCIIIAVQESSESLYYHFKMHSSIYSIISQSGCHYFVSCPLDVQQGASSVPFSSCLGLHERSSSSDAVLIFQTPDEPPGIHGEFLPRKKSSEECEESLFEILFNAIITVKATPRIKRSTEITLNPFYMERTSLRLHKTRLGGMLNS